MALLESRSDRRKRSKGVPTLSLSPFSSFHSPLKLTVSSLTHLYLFKLSRVIPLRKHLRPLFSRLDSFSQQSGNKSTVTLMEHLFGSRFKQQMPRIPCFQLLRRRLSWVLEYCLAEEANGGTTGEFLILYFSSFNIF